MKEQTKQIPLNEWVQEIIKLTGLPAFLLVKVEKSGKIVLKSVSSGFEEMQMTEGAKAEAYNYMG